MISQIVDFRSEVIDLSEFLRELSAKHWSIDTQFKQWTINDVVLHLYASDYLALAAARDEKEFADLRRDILAVRRGGLSMMEESRRRFPALTGEGLRKAWHDQADALCQLLASKDPDVRLAWSGPSMGLRMFVAARQMETWAHGQEIYDALGVDRVPSDRIRNIAVLGAKTFEWAFTNRGLSVPAVRPEIRLHAPSGAKWTFNEASPHDYIEGSAVDFCQVVTQVRNVVDTSLRAQGATARRWMQIAQCFAGPPSDPPSANTRFRTSVGRVA